MIHIAHAKAFKDGTIGSLNVANYLLNLYAKSQNFDYAHKLFDEIPDKDVRSWTNLISGLAQAGCFRTVEGHFRKMQKEGVRPNEFTLSSVLRSCSGAKELRMGRGIHGWIFRNGIELDATLANALLDVYVKSGESRYAERLFEARGERDTVAWNILIDGHLRIGDVEKALALFDKLPVKDAASWNVIINGLIQNGQEKTALNLLYEMVRSGSSLSEVTFSTGLVLASALGFSELGQEIHCCVLRLGINDKRFIRASLLDFYGKCGKMNKALHIFRESRLISDGSTTENVTWSSLLAGFDRNGDYKSALQAFISMIRKGISVNRFAVTIIVSTCQKVRALTLGQQIHAFAHKLGHKLDSPLASSLVEMYSKCGNLKDARSIFEETNQPNVILFSSMISACASHGKGLEAVNIFEKMIRNGTEPNKISFTSILMACSHAGLLKEGFDYFQAMKGVYRIEPEIEHLTCMVDMYSRAGHLDKAKEFINEHGLSRVSPVMKSFLSSCNLHGEIEMAKWASREVESKDDGSHVLLANLFSTNREWDEAARVRELMKLKGIEKLPGQSWIE